MAEVAQAPMLDADRRARLERTYVLGLALVAAVLAALPAIRGLISGPPGSSYLGFQFGTDDHMVYSAWMRQAMDGRFFFDNRFAVDPQPGLTVHLYFFALGLIAKVLGLGLTATLARIGLSVAFVFLLYKLVQRVMPDVFATKLSLALAVFGGGIGFLMWQNFGRDLNRGSPLGTLTGGRLPTDVWQPEAFVFPSMLTNGLFMASLCLMLTLLLSVVKARESWKPVLPGAVSAFLLMNIHSYDMLLVALVLLALAGMSIVAGRLTGAWLARAACIGLGAVPPALWFLHVLQNDPVFQARAATPTYAATFSQVFWGCGVTVLLALLGLVMDGGQSRRRIFAAAGLATLWIALLAMAVNANPDSYFLTWPLWLAVYAMTTAMLCLLAQKDDWINLVWAWAAIGLISPYFPALFQRKLSMGLVIPWAILASLGMLAILRKLDRSARNLTTVLAILVLCGSSLFWFMREVELQKSNVSNTTMHPVYLSMDGRQIVEYLNQHPEKRTVVLAMPGVAHPLLDDQGQAIVGYTQPFIPDLNPILSGLAGVYTYAGHWSETPDYAQRRAKATSFFLQRTSVDQRRALFDEIKPDYIVEFVPEAFPTSDPNSMLADVSGYGEVVVNGSQFRLIRVNPAL